MWNYNPMSNIDDDCNSFIYGCTDSLMFNYNASANTEDGSCIPYIYGCIDSTAYNYDIAANTDNNSCQYCDLSVSLFINNNSSPTSCNGWAFVNYVTSNTPANYLWNNGSTFNNITGLCSGSYYITVTDSVGCSVTDSIYIGTILGCTDPAADNYDATATVDDGSCTYTPSDVNEPAITGLYIDGIIDDRVNANFDNMNTYDANGNQICRVDQISI